MNLAAHLLTSFLAVASAGQLPGYRSATVADDPPAVMGVSGYGQAVIGPPAVIAPSAGPAFNAPPAVMSVAGAGQGVNPPPAVMSVPGAGQGVNPPPGQPVPLPTLMPPVAQQAKSEPAPEFSLQPRDKLAADSKISVAPSKTAQPGSDTLPQQFPGQPEGSHQHGWPEVWGFGGAAAMYGNRMAPNGVPFDPIFDLQGQINFGLLPDKKLYVFFDMDFYGQAAGAAVTAPGQGSFDFSKREWDFDIGLAWNYWDAMELRVYGYALNNLNRGDSLASPFGFNDGFAIENRYYLNNADKYDVGKLSFLSIGYMYPSSTLIGQDGKTFTPGLTLRAYLTHDLGILGSYLYFDGQYLSDSNGSPRLLVYDAGVALRPWEHLQNLEFRVGGSGVYDTQFQYDRSIGYASVRLQF